MIKVEGIKKAFKGREVLKGVTFQADKGSIYGLIGRNGAGKTTLMNIMTGLLESDGGSCVFGNDNNRKTGYLPDLPAFYDYLTTDEYLDFLLMDSNPARRDELLDMVGLPKKAKVRTMSRGMRQRLGIAGVLVNDPDIILLDEPTSALDPAGRNDVKNILMKLKSEGKTIILSTHILADMDSICDKAGFLSGGVIVREVNLAEMKESAKEIVVTFNTKPDLERLYTYTQNIFILDPNTIRIVIDKSNKLSSQKSIMEGLGALDQEIVSITSNSLSLDHIFQEVCV